MEPLFALDIGTRVVVGLLMAKKDQEYEILASSCTEHQQRAMYDGQVHDVDEVARAVRRVKEDLEGKMGTRLRQVSVAAAGRALRTETAGSERREVLPIRWEREDVLALEMEAVQLALRQIGPAEEEDGLPYHCVGYDTIAQWLEGEQIGSLIGQRGRTAKLTVIATFLPRTVVDGLMAVLERVGLEMESLTLEPIAAGQAAIPANMRRLNLALVDVGAGTADIALTKNGSFFAYGMVPMAGDEVTEALCSHFLLDFQAGEKIKRELNSKKTLSLTDFFGQKLKVGRDALLQVIEPSVDKLAEKICGDIMGLNQGPPQAVILIGGGSLTPMLPDKLAEKIGLPRAKVGLQIREHLSFVSGEKALKGPDGITPIGIGIAALEEKGLHYYSVSVNGHQIPIFELELATAAEALLAAGMQPRAFLGRPGQALTYEINGEMKIIKGELGQPAQLLINGRPGRLEQTLQAGDTVHFVPGVPGQDAGAVVADIIPESVVKHIFWQGREEKFEAKVFLNGREAGPADQVSDGVKVLYYSNQDLTHLLWQKGHKFQEKHAFQVRVNGQNRSIEADVKLTLNGKPVDGNCPLADGDRIELIEEKVPLKALGLQAEALVFYVNGREIFHTPANLVVFWRGERLRPDRILEEGMDLHMEVQMPILSEMLPQAVLPQEVPPGAKLSLTVNRREAEFTTVLHPGDRVDIAWK